MRHAPIALLTALLLSAAPARADDPPHSYRLEYTRSPDADTCPDERGFRHLVAANMDGFDVFDDSAAQHLTVTVTRNGHRFDGQITLYDAAGHPLGTRAHKNAPSCSILANRLVTSICLILPRPARPSPPQNSLPPTPAARETSNDPLIPSRQITPSTENASGALGSPPPTLDTASPKREQLDAKPGPRPQLAAGLLVPIGAAPSVTAGFTAAAGVRWPLFSINLEGRADLARPLADQPAGVRATSALYGAALAPCAHLWWLLGCGVVSVAATRISAEQANTIDTWRPRVDLGARLGIRIPLYGRFSAELSGDLLFALNRYGIIIAGRDTWVTPLVTGMPALRIVAAL